MDKKKIIIGVVVIVVVAVVVGVLLALNNKNAGPSGSTTNTITASSTTNQIQQANQQVAQQLGEQVAPNSNGTVIGTKNLTDMSGKTITTSNTTNASGTPATPLPVSNIPSVTLTFGNHKITPSQFTATAGSQLTIILTSNGDEPNHLFIFDDPILSSASLGLSGKETRQMTIRVPSTPGSYAFHCDTPGHRDAGEVGTMIVK